MELLASLLSGFVCLQIRGFDWWSKLLHLQALRPSQDAGSLDYAASLAGGLGSDRLRSLA